MKELTKKLSIIQHELKAPKNQFNDFGNFSYRNCEDILEALKPLLQKHELVLTLSDEIVNVNQRYYMKATATITDGEDSLSTCAYAREAETKKGMDEAQISGSAGSYARKYALNGLFCIDDTKDPDTMDNSKTEQKNTYKPKPKVETEKLLATDGDRPSLRQTNAVVSIAKAMGETLDWGEVNKTWTAKEASEYIEKYGYTGKNE